MRVEGGMRAKEENGGSKDHHSKGNRGPLFGGSRGRQRAIGNAKFYVLGNRDDVLEFHRFWFEANCAELLRLLAVLRIDRADQTTTGMERSSAPAD
jgi:hypothetical protein